MNQRDLSDKLTVIEVLDAWPAVIPVFQHFRTACIGCAMAPFCTLDDVPRYHDLDPSLFLESLVEAIEIARAGTSAAREAYP